MSETTKKGICCDYCQIGSSIGQIYTVKKHFAGKRALDILQIVTKRVIPLSATIKICSLCMSTLLSTMVVVEKITSLVDKFIEDNPNAQKKCSVKKTTYEHNSSNVNDENTEAADDAKGPVTLLSAKSPNMRSQKVQEEEEESPRKAIVQKTKVVAATKSPKKLKTNLNVTKDMEVNSAVKSVSPKKIQSNTPNKSNASLQADTNHQPDEIDDLQNAVKLTPSKAISTQKRAFLQLFGPRDNLDDKTESEDDDNESEAEKPGKTQRHTYECKQCDFSCNKGYVYKSHLKDVHDQKRPRIYECSVCPKSFGLQKTLKIHLETHGIILPKKGKAEKKKSVSFSKKDETASKVKVTENGQSTEYTFAVNNGKTSTPKPAVNKNCLEFQCDICDSELKTLKSMTDHMKTAHGIEKPKPFQCNICNLRYTSKQNVLRHMKELHKIENPDLNASKSNYTDIKLVIDESSDASEVPTIKPVEAAKRKLPKKHVKNAEIENKSNDELDSSKLNGNKKITKPRRKTISEGINLTPQKSSKKTVSDEELMSLSFSALNASKRKSSESISENTNNKLEKRLPQVTEKSFEKKVPDEELNSLSFSALNARKRKSSENISENTHNKVAKLLPQVTEKSFQNELVSNDDGSDATDKELNQNNRYPPLSTIIDIIDEINLDVRPHKRELLSSEPDESVLSCSQCGKIAGTRKRLDSHIRKKHKKALKCRTCNNQYATSVEFVEHFNGSCAGAPEGLPCGAKACSKVFQTGDYLLSHIKKKHPWA